LYQTATITYHALKIKRISKSLQKNRGKRTPFLEKIERKSNQILAYQWAGSLANLALLGVSSYISYYVSFCLPKTEIDLELGRRISLGIGLVSGVGELILNWITTQKVKSLAEEATQAIQGVRNLMKQRNPCTV
jgi:hypothetical protein